MHRCEWDVCAYRSPTPPPRAPEPAAPPAERKSTDDSEKLRGDLLRVRNERSQAQQESAQLQMQLQELADKANGKLYDYRLKLKGAKKRSQLRFGVITSCNMVDSEVLFFHM